MSSTPSIPPADSVVDRLPAGFRSAGVACGIKSDPTTPDLALFVSDQPCTAAGVFTRNHVVGAPVQISRQRVPGDTVRAVVINSGNANACTGERGLKDAADMCRAVAEQLGCDEESVLICSTGVIGHFLPMPVILDGIPLVVGQLSDQPESLIAAATAMKTTDTFHKLSTRTAKIGETTARVVGAAKGAAMIGPNMATMLAVIMTDAALSPEQADNMLRSAVDDSFHCISVEGHTSTSDSVILLAGGQAGAPTTDADNTALADAVRDVCRDLAQAIIRDAEGADHFITIRVTGARSRAEAHQVAKTVADGALVKTAITGADPNWGRIVSAVGYCGIPVAETEISLQINGTPIYAAGAPLSYNESELSNSIRTNRDVEIHIELTHGEADITFWTSDLTQEYVRLNSEYTT